MSPIRIDPDNARNVLEDAVHAAQSHHKVSSRWVEHTEQVGSAASKTYVAALGTALLARATDDRIDPMSIKASPDVDRAYSARTLCHGVLVPASREYGFDLGATGREPLNNQPFFRYERMDEMERVRDRAGLRLLLDALRDIDTLHKDQAQAGLAAFVRVRTDVADSKRRTTLRELDLGVTAFINAANQFVTERPDGGKRGQALVAGILDVVFDDVRMGRVNDPSRRFPGDVQAMNGAQVVLAAEVRQKLVTQGDALAFARVAAEAGVVNAVVVALERSQSVLDENYLRVAAEEEHGVLLSVVDSVASLITTALVWSRDRTDIVLSAMPQRIADRLHEIEASETSLRRWASIVSAPPR